MSAHFQRLRKALSVSQSVPPGDASRDHQANERTFLTWLRFSMSISIVGVVMAQISQIQRVVHPNRDHEYKYYALGTPQACICQIVAIAIVSIGAARFFKQERALVSGQVMINGWDLWIAVGLLFVVLAALLALLFLFNVIGAFDEL